MTAEIIPKWASEEISAQLPKLRETGETNSVDFKEDFPDQAHRLGKEIAAMATSGGGRIFLGPISGGRIGCGPVGVVPWSGSGGTTFRSGSSCGGPMSGLSGSQYVLRLAMSSSSNRRVPGISPVTATSTSST